MYVVKNAISREWKDILQTSKMKLTIGKALQLSLYDPLEKKWFSLTDVNKSKQLYNILVYRNQVKPSIMYLWEIKFQNKTIQWNKVFTHKLCYVKEQKIVAFNFKLLYNIVATPENLCKWKLSDSAICYMCFTKGSLQHMMLECSYFREFFVKIKQIFSSLGIVNINFDLYTLICGYKVDLSEYVNVNLILSLIFFTVYKTWMMVYVKRIYSNPLIQLSVEMNKRGNTKTYNFIMWKQFQRKLSVHL